MAQARPFDASLVNRELLTKSKILKSEAPAARDNQLEQANERGNQLNHCYQDVRTAGLPSSELRRKFFNPNGYVVLANDSQNGNPGSKLQRDVIACGVFTSTADLTRKLRRYINPYSKHAKPFRWKYSHPSRHIRHANTFSKTVH